MRLNNVEIENTYAEAFTMYASRITVTAINETWAEHAAKAVTGYATSIIGCEVEAGIEGKTINSPDGRPGFDCLFFAASKDKLAEIVFMRIGQAVLTSPTSACYDAGFPEYPSDYEGLSKFVVGGNLKFFGDGFEKSEDISGKRFWRVPVMDGEFLVQEEFTIAKVVGGGNFLILAESVESALKSAEAAVASIKGTRGVILPFPGGVVRSGSKVGSKYDFMIASTNEVFCPTLRGQVENSMLTEDINAVYEIIIDGVTKELVAKAMETGIRAATAAEIPGVKRITAGNYGGLLGDINISLYDILGDNSE